jgi:hypothetical protein
MKTIIPARQTLAVLHRLVRLPWAMWKHHRFFCHESLKYSGKSITAAPLQVSRAWLRFMWFGLCDECSIIRMKLTDPMEDRMANASDQATASK